MCVSASSIKSNKQTASGGNSSDGEKEFHILEHHDDPTIPTPLQTNQLNYPCFDPCLAFDDGILARGAIPGQRECQCCRASFSSLSFSFSFLEAFWK